MVQQMTFIEDHAFQRHCRDLLNDDELMTFLVWLSSHPNEGKIIRRGGGLRKVRWGGSGRGKRGGVRVIYFWWISDEKILLLDIYAKNEKEDLTPAEIKNLKAKVIE
jgi:mRNA-degrading endonuclease RelE of RelBE toxin-antitoxin system